MNSTAVQWTTKQRETIANPQTNMPTLYANNYLRACGRAECSAFQHQSYETKRQKP